MKFVFDSHEEIRDYATHTLHMVNAPEHQPAYIDNSGLHPFDVQQMHQPAQQPAPTGQAPTVSPVQTTAQPAPAAPAAPQPAPVQQTPVTPPPAQPAPVQQPAPAAQPLPTTAVTQEYTQDQISVAMAGLVSQGKQPEIMALIQGFGVSSLVELPKEQYGALAVKLREMGAQI